MKISKERLKFLIKEELTNVLEEMEDSTVKALSGLEGGASDLIGDLGSTDPDEEEFYSSREGMIHTTLLNLGIDPNSTEGQQISHDLMLAAEKNAARAADWRSSGDPLANKQKAISDLGPKGFTKKGKASADRRAIVGNAARGEIGLDPLSRRLGRLNTKK